VVLGQVSFRQGEEPEPTGLRSLKKARSRVAIEDAALALFDEQGYDATTVEQVAAMAEVSPTTVFRYFPTKADLLLSDHGQHLPALAEAIVNRPADESDLVAIRRGLIQVWVQAIDPERTAHRARIVATSPTLQGLSFQLGSKWLGAIAGALARRRGLDQPDDRSQLAARVALAVHATAVFGWMMDGCRGDLTDAVDRAFELMADLSAQWSTSDT
jgi:AcrR family transcriptional regulator